jgi:hypothetical protein
MDAVQVKLWVPDQKTLKDILSLGHFTLDCGAPKRDATGNFIITLYGPKAETDKLKPLKLKMEFDEKYGDVLDARRKQVSQTDRFEGGKIKPEGLGIKQ